MRKYPTAAGWLAASPRSSPRNSKGGKFPTLVQRSPPAKICLRPPGIFFFLLSLQRRFALVHLLFTNHGVFVQESPAVSTPSPVPIMKTTWKDVSAPRRSPNKPFRSQKHSI